MSIIRINYDDLMNKGNQLQQIEQLIDARRNMLIEKQKKLRFISKQNAFLTAVKDDYDKYNNYIIKQREDQMKAFQVINYYLDDLKRSGELTKSNIQDSKYEQQKIVNEIKKIQRNMDKLILDSNEVSNQVSNFKL
jgi:hypothetical protein